MSHNVVSVRPLSSIFQLYSYSPDLPGFFLTTAETLDYSYCICRKHGCKILWISNDTCGLKGEILSAPDDPLLTWQPLLTRERVKDIYGSQQSYCKFLAGDEKLAQPKKTR